MFLSKWFEGDLYIFYFKKTAQHVSDQELSALLPLCKLCLNTSRYIFESSFL